MRNLGTPLPLAGGGTGANTAAGAVTALGLANQSTFTDVSFNNTSSPQTVDTSFPRISLPNINRDTGSNWSAANNWYTCPKNGVYQITATIRVADSTAAGTTYSLGIYTTEADGPWHLWTGATGAPRNTFAYSRLSYQNAGDKLRMFSFSDKSGGVPIISAGLQIMLVSNPG